MPKSISGGISFSLLFRSLNILRKGFSPGFTWQLCSHPGDAVHLNCVRQDVNDRVDVSCQLRTLPEIIAEYQLNRIDLLKVDAERAELGIMQSLSDQDWSKIRQAIVEVHDGFDVDPILEILRQQGFRVTDDVNPLVPEVHLLYAVR